MLAPLAASGKVIVKGDGDILTAADIGAEIFRLELIAVTARAAAGGRPAAEHAAQQILETAGAAARTAAASLEAVGAETEALETAPWPKPPCPKPPPGCCAPSKPRKRGLPSASISPLSNALRLSSSPTIS